MATIAMPLAKDFEDSEFKKPYDAFRDAGHEVVIIGSKRGATVEGKRRNVAVMVERSAKEVAPEDFDAVVIAGGYSPDHLRSDAAMVDFIRRFDDLNRLIAAICHGPQLLIDAKAIRRRRMTSFPSIRKDLENAGAIWVDEEVCEDGDLITSRTPDDLEGFTDAILRRLNERYSGAELLKRLAT